VFRPLRWIGSAREDFEAMPTAVQETLGLALMFARLGCKHAKAHALSGCGDAGILEVVEEHGGSAYWAVYSVRYVDTVYILHCSEQRVDGDQERLRRDLGEIRTRLKIVELFKRGG